MRRICPGNLVVLRARLVPRYLKSWYRGMDIADPMVMAVALSEAPGGTRDRWRWYVFTHDLDIVDVKEKDLIPAEAWSDPF